MKEKLKLVLVLCMVCQCSLSSAQELVIEIQNIKQKDGQMIISLFSNADNFLKKPAYEKFVDVDSNSAMTIVLKDVPKGNYALCVIHDKNKSGNLDTNLFKIPKEPYGFSLNPKSKFGPPHFDAARFNFENDTALKVLLN